MSKESKILGGILVGIVVLMVGGFMLFGGSSSSKTTGTKVDAAKLTNADAQTVGTGKVQVVEFGDYQCPACGVAHPALKQLADQNANDITFVFRDFPLQIHPNAKPAAYAANAAAVQGKFWEMHNKLYENQKEWVDLPDPTDVFVGYAQGLGLDIDKFKASLKDDAIAAKVQRGIDDGTAINVAATPTVYINGVQYTGAFTYDELKAAVDAAK